MAETQKKKKTASSGKKTAARTGRSVSGTKNTKKKAKAPSSPAADRTQDAKTGAKRPDGLGTQLLPFVFLVAAVFFLICLTAEGVGVIGNGLRGLLMGLTGGTAYTIPIYFLLAAVMWRSDAENGLVPWKAFCFGSTFLLSTVLMHFLAAGPDTLDVVEQYAAGLQKIGGGLIGGVLGTLMMRGFGQILSLILLFAVLFVFVLLLFGVTPRGLWVLIAYKVKMSRERAALRRSMEQEKQEKKYHEIRPAKAASTAVQLPLQPPRDATRGHADIDWEDDVSAQPVELAEPVEEEHPATSCPSQDTADDSLIDERIFEEVMRRTQDRMSKNGIAVGEEIDAAADFSEKAEEDTVSNPEDLPWNETIPAEREPSSPMPYDSVDALEAESLDLSSIFAEKSDAELLLRLEQDDSPKESEEPEDMETELELSVERRQLWEKQVAVPHIAESADSTEVTSDSAPLPYQFPPVDLLEQEEAVRDENVTEELRENAARLVETLRNFNVRTKIVDVCRGPTITRYELAPEPGTKVRSIANLVDDIALNLATSGVRFDPSIPGKSAVGIEVPNKNAATVHLRTLLENPRFAAAKSRLTAALGQDVAGGDVFLDVARMPHLLIAGATGQGKSVCINSLIVSLLYKARPDELKFIMVDPKKVELNVYNGIPHLYMPVISDPKKAAGALTWAVSEMERRYSLIEEVGVRDLKSYNEITKDDPAYEFLPQFVIIIDELADLMMVAKNDVEDPICRIAQKARAAGMHLIIGTQRPSVDVITGLIKANFPSRISFRVSQLVDSRTIIDRAGAESLVGRGDMLYSPVGAHEPMRVQGSFVSDEEVERVVEFIKMHNGRAEYDSGAIEEVEKNAATIGSGKKGRVVENEEMEAEEDPMLRPAIELAVESGKISTSLIQRRLSLGYGRAAKLIDRMEQLGYVSPPEGQKPRNVLLTKEQFMEMVLRDTDI